MNLFRLLGMALSSFSLMAEDPRDQEQIQSVGGQAVMEGVVMRGKGAWGLAVRDQSGSIVRDWWPEKSLCCFGLEKWPILRGAFTMVEMFRHGMKALTRSCEIALGETEELTTKDKLLTGLLAFVFVVGLFMVIPHFCGRLVGNLTNGGVLTVNLVEGVVRGLVFVLYLALIGLWGDMARVLAYHGAEHKTINTWESGKPMTLENVVAQSRIHPRCGTSFLLIVVLVSILVFSLIGDGSFLYRIAMRVVLMPVVVGVSYEIIRFSSRSSLGRMFMKPALLLQYLTTREPDENQVQVGMAALDEALMATKRLAQSKES